MRPSKQEERGQLGKVPRSILVSLISPYLRVQSFVFRSIAGAEMRSKVYDTPASKCGNLAFLLLRFGDSAFRVMRVTGDSSVWRVTLHADQVGLDVVRIEFGAFWVFTAMGSPARLAPGLMPCFVQYRPS